MMNRFLGASALLLFCPALASAQLLVPLSQERSVSGDAIVDDGNTILSDSDFDQALNFGQFMSAASADSMGFGGRGSGGASQTTEIFASSFSGIGSGFADTEASDPSWSADASGASVATLVFHVGTKVAYNLAGRVTAFDNGVAVTHLRPVGGAFMVQEASIGDGDIFVDASGVLSPGDYEVSFRAFGGAQSFGSGFDFAFASFSMTLDLTPVASNYCVAAANSVGPGAQLSLGGTQAIGANDFRVEASGALPNGFGLVFYGPNQIQAPFGDGFRCVGGQTFRVQPPIQADGTGFVSKAVSFTSGPASGGLSQITPMSTWNFQLWYRDPAGPGGSGYNTSDALSVVFCP